MSMENKAFTIVAFALLLPACYSCSSKRVVTRPELNSYIQDSDNGLTKKVKTGNLMLELTYKPVDLVLAEQIEGERLSKSEIDSIRKNFSQYDYFIFRISSDGQEVTNSYAGNQAAFTKSVEHLSFGVGKDFSIEVNNESIPVRDFFHARSFGGDNANSVLLAFESNLLQRGDDNFTVIFEDAFFKSGKTLFNFKIEDIKAIPTLDLISSAL